MAGTMPPGLRLRASTVQAEGLLVNNLDLRMDLWSHSSDLLSTLIDVSTRLRVAASTLNSIMRHPSGDDILRVTHDEITRRIR